MNAPTDETRGKNEAHTVWNDHSQSACHFQTCSQILCFICNRKQLGEFEAFGKMFSIHLWVKRQRAARCLPMTREWLLRLPAWGGKMRCYSQWRHRAEKVGDETKMCLFMPTGVLTLLQAAIAFCQERELKGPFTKHKDFHSLFPPYPACTVSSGLLKYLWGAKRATLPLMFIQNKTRSCLFKVETKDAKVHTAEDFQSKGEGHGEFRAKTLTDGCRGTLVSAASPQRPGCSGCEQSTSSWDHQWQPDLNL